MVDGACYSGGNQLIAGTIETTTFCTGLWHLKKNTKKNFSQYLDVLPKTLEMVAGGNVVAISDSEMVLDAFDRVAKDLAIQMALRMRTIEELPFYPDSAAMLESCKSMGAVNWLTLLRIKDRGRKIYRREWKAGGDENYRAIMSIWMSKTPLVIKYAVRENPFSTEYSAWMDASVSRFNKRRENWHFAKCTFAPGKLNHYGTKSRYKGRLMKINCSFLAAQNDVWPNILRLFEAETKASFRERYAHDDETLMNRLLAHHPDLFETLGQPIPSQTGAGSKNQDRNMPSLGSSAP